MSGMAPTTATVTSVNLGRASRVFTSGPRSLPTARSTSTAARPASKLLPNQNTRYQNSGIGRPGKNDRRRE
eukprot:7262388-Pyramimonas_sp.AAC.1